METNIAVDISPPVLCLEIFWFLGWKPKYCQPIKLQDSLKCNNSGKKGMIKFIFGMMINVELFYKLILSFYVWATRHAQSTQNKKFAYLCNISRKAWGWNWFFLPANKHESFLHYLGLAWPGMPKVPKTISLQYLRNISRKM